MSSETPVAPRGTVVDNIIYVYIYMIYTYIIYNTYYLHLNFGLVTYLTPPSNPLPTINNTHTNNYRRKFKNLTNVKS